MPRQIVPAASLAAILTAAALSACGGGNDSDGKPSAPDVAANFARPLDARGGEPAWDLTIRGTTLTLSQPNQPPLTVTAPGAVIQAHKASWTAALPDGRSMTVTFYASSCADPASGVTYPFSVEAQLPGAAPLDGCGGPPAAAGAPRAAAPVGGATR
jgi:uncharacterized membrane protein